MSSIQELDSAAQKLSIVGILHVSWSDEFLSWNKSEFGGINSINAFQNEIWRPQIFLGAPLDDFYEVGLPTTPVNINYKGRVTWRPVDVFTFRCTVNTRFYPIDTQVCFLDFGLKGYSVNELELVSNSDEVILHRFEENVEWELVSATSNVIASNEGGISTQGFRNTLTLKRRPAFIIVHSVLPMMLLSVLNILVFVLPTESGEKISLSITMFLAFAIFLTMLSDSLPRNSLTLPIFSMYCILINVLSTLYVILTVFVLKVYHKPTEEPVPQFIHTFYMLCRRFRGPICSRKVEQEDDDVHTISLSKQDAGTNQFLSKDKINEHVEHTVVTWLDVSRTLDVTFAWLFSILLMVATVIFGFFLGFGS